MSIVKNFIEAKSNSIAEHFAKIHGERLLYLGDKEGWYYKDRIKFENCDDQFILKLIRDCVIKLKEDSNNYAVLRINDKILPKEEYLKEINKYLNPNKLNKILNILPLLDGIMAKPQDFDQDQREIACQNGILNLETGQLSEFAPSHKLLQIANVPYNAEAKCPLFHSFIKHIFNEDKELIDFVQVLCGYLFTGLTWEQKLFILYGLGSNGKSLFVSILLHIAGDYGISTPSNTLLENGSSGIRNDLARLRNRRIVAASETNLGKRFDEAGIKILTGEDKIVCRKLYSDYFEYSTQYKVLLTVNNLPRIRGNDKGIKRRICIIPFNVTFENNKCDKELKEKLLKESEGIFAWIIEGSKRYFKNGLLECQAVINATANYLNEMDTIQTFLGDMCRVDANNKKLKIPVKTLYSCYETWAKENCLEPVGKYNFGESIKEKGIVQGKSGSVRYWQGVIIRR